MRKARFRKFIITCIMVIVLVFNFAIAQAASSPHPGKLKTKPVNNDKSEAAKQYTLDWLDSDVVQKYFAEINDAIWSYAELGLEEYNTADLIQYVMEQYGFKIERGVADMPTALLASYTGGKEGPVIAIMGEFDALPMLSQEANAHTHKPVVKGAPGHGCTHNTMATAGAAATIAVKLAMEEYGIEGTVRYYGSPAEETLISRPYFVDAGLFDDVDVVIDNHGGNGFGTSYGIGGTAMYSFLVTFTGKTGHAASPWTGRSALKAVELMNTGTNLLKEHLFYSHRMHYAVIDGGEAPNVMPDKATVWYFIRESDDRLDDMLDKVLDCAEGAAIATGTEYEVQILTGIHQSYNNKALAELIYKNIERVGMPKWSEEEHKFAKNIQKSMGWEKTGLSTKINPLRDPSPVFVGGGSTDMGTVSLYRPTASVSFPSKGPSDGHHWSTVAYTGTSIAHKGLISGAKAMAATAIDLLTKPEEVEKIWDEFKELQKERPFFSRLPKDAKPPVGFYREQMDKYRPLMEKFYKEPKWYPGSWSLKSEKK